MLCSGLLRIDPQISNHPAKVNIKTVIIEDKEKECICPDCGYLPPFLSYFLITLLLYVAGLPVDPKIIVFAQRFDLRGVFCGGPTYQISAGPGALSGRLVKCLILDCPDYIR